MGTTLRSMVLHVYASGGVDCRWAFSLSSCLLAHITRPHGTCKMYAVWEFDSDPSWLCKQRSAILVVNSEVCSNVWDWYEFQVYSTMNVGSLACLPWWRMALTSLHFSAYGFVFISLVPPEYKFQHVSQNGMQSKKRLRLLFVLRSALFWLTFLC